MFDAFKQAIERQDYDAASLYINDMPKNSTGYWNAQLQLARIYEEQDAFEKAQSHLRALLADVEDPFSRTYLRDLLEQFHWSHNMPPECYDLADISSAPRLNCIFVTGFLGVPIDTYADNIAKLFGRPYFATNDDFKNRWELDIFDFVNNKKQGAVLGQAVRCTTGNLQLLQVFAPKPIVIVQNIFDAMACWAHTLHLNPQIERATADIEDLSSHNLLEYVVHKWGYWYLECYASWVQAIKNQSIDALIVNVESSSEELPHLLKQHLKLPLAKEEPFLKQLEVSRSDWSLELQRRWLAHFQRHASYFPDVEFDAVGL